MPDRSPLLRVCRLLNEAQAWKVAYADAIATAREVVIEGVRIPFLGLDALIASKETYREQDAWDRARLLELKRRLSESHST